MTVVSAVCAVLLGSTGLLCLWRIVRGPTTLDRTVAADVFVAACIGAVGVEAAVSRRDTSFAILVSLSLVAFVGSVAVARFAARDAEPTDPPEEDR